MTSPWPAVTPDTDYPVTRDRVSVSGGSLHYEVTGQGPAVVFAHGLGGNHRSWWQQVPVFRSRFTCVTFAHRGFIPSADASGRPRPHRYADDLAALLDRLGIERTAIVAQSMGGWTGLEFALRFPDRVGALVLCGSTGSFAHPGLAGLAGFTGGDLRARGIHPAAGERMLREQPELHELYTEIDRSSGTWDRDAVRRDLDAMRVREAAEVARLDCRLLAMVGEEDLVCPPGNVRLLAAAVPGSELAVVSGAGHSVYFERAAAFNEMVSAFLEPAGGAV